MAIAGDIIIKLAADFAQFAEGMTQSTKALGDLGKEAQKTSASLESAIGWLKGLAGTAAVAFVVSKVTAYTAAIDQQALAVAKLEKQYKLSAIEVQALQGEVEKTGKSFAELAEHAGKNPKWLDSIILDAQTAGTALDEGVVRSISDMDAKSTEATKKINAMFAPFYASTKATALENIANTLDGIIALMNRAANHEGFWSKMGSLFRSGVLDPATGPREKTEREKDLEDMENAAKRVTAAQQEIERAAQRGANNPRHDAVRAAELAAAQRELDKLRNAEVNRAARASAGIVGNAETNVPFIPDLPKEDKGKAGGGGGGGRTDAETIDALIARYGRMQKAAEAATDATRADTASDIKDLAIFIEAKQAAADTIAKIAQTKVIAPGQEEALSRAIFLAKQAQAEQNRTLQDAVAADKLQKTLGDGTEAYADAVNNLNRQLATGRLHQDAYNRSLKQQSEAINQAAYAAARYDDNLGSLAAGFQSAAAQYARSNDLFSEGGQIFNSVTGAMGEGLDALSGKSSKTFAQIAGDFATMLTKMALQAALSPVLKYLSNSIGSLFGPATLDTGASNTVWQSMGLTGRAGGGDVYAGQSYMVGEYGPERFVPAAAGRIEPGGGGDMYVNIANYSDASVTTKKSKGPGGQMQLDVIVAAVESKIAGNVSLGRGSLGKTMEGKYGLQPVGR